VPVLFAGIAAKHGVMVSNTKFLKVPNPGFGIFPLFSDKPSQPSHYPYFEPFKEGFSFSEPEIIPPSPKVLVQFLDYLPQAFTPLAAG
jgi:hypothetical protein